MWIMYDSDVDNVMCSVPMTTCNTKEPLLSSVKSKYYPHTPCSTSTPNMTVHNRRCYRLNFITIKNLVTQLMVDVTYSLITCITNVEVEYFVKSKNNISSVYV